MTSTFIRKGVEAQGHRESGYVKMEAEVRVMCLQDKNIKDCLGLLKTRRGKEKFFLRGIRGNTALPTP